MPRVHPSKLDLIQLEDERDSLMKLCREDVVIMAKRMVNGKDTRNLADLMGISRKTFRQKLNLGRFTASEFFYLARICAYDIEAKDHFQLMIDDVLSIDEP